MTEIITGDFSNRQHTNAVIVLAMRNNFYVDNLWNMLLRKLSPSTTKQLRTAGWSDARIAEAERQAFAKYDKFNWGFRLLMKEGNVIGFCFWDYPKKEGKGCCFEFLLVDEAERGKKYGKMLMDDFLAWTDANGRTEIKIQFENSRMLRTFYTKYGFKNCGDVEKEDADCPLNVWYRGL